MNVPSTREKKTDLHDKTIFFSNRSHCSKIMSGGSFVADKLFSDHEEADTKPVVLVQAADVAPGEAVMVRSPSGDIDILALFLGHDLVIFVFSSTVELGKVVK